ncbi:MAG: hypothetical protein A2033_06010 [Bacteroidetes bacterium GWA2_31_9]|nr:MAG: hypothetical protein A2033_06010 [Bacteroidetes bacterium GWA2_31_9]
MIKKILFTLTIILAITSTYAQTGSIKGFVYDKENGEPIIFCNVYLTGGMYGAVTDVNGYYNITKVKPGSYTLVVSYLGYDSLGVKITVKGNDIITQKLQISKSTIKLNETIVSADRQEMKTDVRASVVKISPKQITQIPAIGAQPDIAQYLQILPGVIFTGDQGGQLYIRGGPPIENKVLLDGMIIYNPFHSIGLFSVFDTDVIRNVDVFTGGFGAEYGGRISSVMDITTRDGNKKKIGGKISGDTFGSKLLLEGPIFKQNKETGGSSSFMFSGKTSYLKESSKLFYSYIDTAGLPFNFTDYYGKVSFNGQNGSKFNLFGFRFSDNVKYQAVSDLNWKSYGFGTNIIVVPAGSSVLIKSNLSYSRYNISLKELDDKERNSLVNGFNVGLGFLYYFGKNEFTYGFEINGFKTDFNFYNSIGRRIWQVDNTTELGAYFKYKMNIKEKLLLEPSLRFQWYASLSRISPEPRLGVKYNINDKLRVKIAGGMYSQNLISANSDRDVVNLFYGFLSGPDAGNLQEEFDGKPVKHSLQTSIHYIAGFEYDFSNKITGNIEGYYKHNTQLTNINRNKLYDDVAANSKEPDVLKKDFIIETGRAYGVDFLVKYDFKRTYFWAVYSLGFVERYDGYMTYNPHFDRRHNVNLVASHTFGKNLNWEFSARWNLGSGFPFTQTQGFYEKVPFADGISTDYTTSNGELGIMYGEVNQGRLPYYHRLDASLKKFYEFGKNSRLEMVLSVTNLYNRQNIFYFDRVKYEKVNQLPIMPTLGFSLNF